MPNISLFLEVEDAKNFVSLVLGDPEVFIVTEDLERREPVGKGEKWWRAVRSYEIRGNCTFVLWHRLSGSLLKPNLERKGPDYFDVKNPEDGWCALYYSSYPDIPAMGDTSRVVRVELEFVNRHAPNELGLSSISWIGSHYETPSDGAKRFWDRLKRVVKSQSSFVLGDGQTSHRESKFPAWPTAFARIAKMDPWREI